MKRLLLLCFILALIGLSCAPEATLEISVNEVDNGIIVENVGTVDCIVYVKSLDAKQEFQLAVGESRLITDIEKPIEVSAVTAQHN